MSLQVVCMGAVAGAAGIASTIVATGSEDPDHMIQVILPGYSHCGSSAQAGVAPAIPDAFFSWQ